MRQPTAPTAAQPLASLLNPPPDRRPGTLNGTAVAGAAAYAMEPKNCSLDSQRITVDLNGQYDRVAGNIQLDDAAPASTRTQFAATADGVALDDFVLSPKAGASFDLSVKDRATLEISLESLGQGSCESDDYLVLVTSALAYPRQP